MSSITRRRTGEFLRKLMELLMNEPEGMKASEALEQLRACFVLSEFEQGNMPSGGLRFEVTVRFATVDLVKAGWMQKDKGRWRCTEAGREAYEQHLDPEAFYRRATQLYRQWRESRPESAVAETIIDTPEAEPSAKSVSITFEAAEEQAWGEISEYLSAMPPYEFQQLVAALLRAMDYHVQWVAPPGKDGGIDIFASVDALATRPPRIKVQVKRQQQAVNVESLRAFLALLGDDDAGLFVCTGGFTRDATELARQQERRKVTLVDMEKLFDLWVEHYPKLKEEARQRFPLRPIYFLAPAE